MRRRPLLPLAPRLAPPPPPRNRRLPLPSPQELGDGVVPLLNIAEVASYNIEHAHTQIAGGQGVVYLCW